MSNSSFQFPQHEFQAMMNSPSSSSQLQNHNFDGFDNQQQSFGNQQQHRNNNTNNFDGFNNNNIDGFDNQQQSFGNQQQHRNNNTSNFDGFNNNNIDGFDNQHNTQPQHFDQNNNFSSLQQNGNGNNNIAANMAASPSQCYQQARMNNSILHPQNQIASPNAISTSDMVLSYLSKFSDFQQHVQNFSSSSFTSTTTPQHQVVSNNFQSPQQQQQAQANNMDMMNNRATNQQMNNTNDNNSNGETDMSDLFNQQDQDETQTQTQNKTRYVPPQNSTLSSSHIALPTAMKSSKQKSSNNNEKNYQQTTLSTSAWIKPSNTNNNNNTNNNSGANSSTISMPTSPTVSNTDNSMSVITALRNIIKDKDKSLVRSFELLLQKATDRWACLPINYVQSNQSETDNVLKAGQAKANNSKAPAKTPDNMSSCSREEFLFLKRLLVNTGMVDGRTVNSKEVLSDLRTLIKYGKDLQTELEIPMVSVRIGCDQINKKFNDQMTLVDSASFSKEFNVQHTAFLLRASVLPEIIVLDPVYAGEKSLDDRGNPQFTLRCANCPTRPPLRPDVWKYRRLYGDEEASILVYKSYICYGCSARARVATQRNQNNDDDDDDGRGDDYASSQDDDDDDDDEYFENVGGPKVDPADRLSDEKTRNELDGRTKNKDFENTMNSAGSWLKSRFGARFTSKYAYKEKILNDCLQVVDSRSNIHEYASQMSKRYGEAHLKRVHQMLQLMTSWRFRLQKKGVTDNQWFDIMSFFSPSANAVVGGNVRYDPNHAKACRLLRSPLIPAPSYSFLRSSVLEPELELIRKALQKCLEVLGNREVVSIDGTYRVAGSTSDGHSSIQAIYFAVNKLCQVLSCVFVPSDHLSNLETWLRQLNVGHAIDVIYTDKCCTDKNVLKKCLGNAIKIRLDLFHFHRRYAIGLNPRYNSSHRLIIKTLCDAIKEPVPGHENRIRIPSKEECKKKFLEAIEGLKQNDACKETIESDKFQYNFDLQMSHIDAGCLEDPYDSDGMYIRHVSDRNKESTFRGTNSNEGLHMIQNSKAISSSSQHPVTSRNNILFIVSNRNYERSINYLDGETKIKFVNPRTLSECKIAWRNLLAPSHDAFRGTGRSISLLEKKIPEQKEANPFYTKYFEPFALNATLTQQMFEEYLERNSGPKTSLEHPVLRFCLRSTYIDAVSRLFEHEFETSICGSIGRIISPVPDPLPKPRSQVGRRLFPGFTCPNDLDKHAGTDGSADLQMIHDFVRPDHQHVRTLIDNPRNALYVFSNEADATCPISTLKRHTIDSASRLMIEILDSVFQHDLKHYIPPLLSSDETDPPPGTAVGWAKDISRSFHEMRRKFVLNDLDNMVAEFLQQTSDITTCPIVLLRTGAKIRSPFLGIAGGFRPQAQAPQSTTYPPYEKDVPIFIPRRDMLPYLCVTELDRYLRGIILVHCNHFKGTSFTLSFLGHLPLLGDNFAAPRIPSLPLHQAFAASSAENKHKHAFDDPPANRENPRGRQQDRAVPMNTARIEKMSNAGNVTDPDKLSPSDLGKVVLVYDAWKEGSKKGSKTSTLESELDTVQFGPLITKGTPYIVVFPRGDKTRTEDWAKQCKTRHARTTLPLAKRNNEVVQEVQENRNQRRLLNFDFGVGNDDERENENDGDDDGGGDDGKNDDRSSQTWNEDCLQMLNFESVGGDDTNQALLRLERSILEEPPQQLQLTDSDAAPPNRKQASVSKKATAKKSTVAAAKKPSPASKASPGGKTSKKK